MSTQTARNDITAQDGAVFTGLGGIWIDTSGSLLSDTGQVGIIFDLSTAIDFDLTISQPNKLIFQVNGSLPSTTDTGVSIYLLDEAEPADYDDTLIPGSRDEVSADNLVCTAMGDYIGGDADWDSDTDFTFELGSDYDDGVWTANATYQAILDSFWARQIRISSWTGRLAFSLIYDDASGNRPLFFASENATEARRPRLGALEWAFNTGHDTGGVGRRGRAKSCARSGIPANTADLIEDGYRPGNWVLADWWEPEERFNETSPRDTEGEIDDKVTGE